MTEELLGSQPQDVDQRRRRAPCRTRRISTRSTRQRMMSGRARVVSRNGAGNRTATIRKIGEVVADLNVPCGHVPRRVRIEVSDIPANPFNVG